MNGLSRGDIEARLPIVQVRIARPTDRLDDVIRFYRDVIGLPVIASFRDHAGFDGVMIGLPDPTCHLEFTHHEPGSPAPAPNAESLLVLYIPDRHVVDDIVARLVAQGHAPAPSFNPYWVERGAITVEDPDGWRVVLMPAEGISH